MIRILFFVYSFFLLSLDVFASDTPCQSNPCMAVVDAGSSGTRLHIFSYELDNTNTPINIHEIWTKKNKPGISNLELTAINNYFTNLFTDAPVNHIPVYLYATGGMRLLSANQQNQIYKQIDQWFTQQSDWTLQAAKTISGNDEALFDWLSVNYQLGTLQSANTQSIGVMDMGGASVQIAFPIKTSEPTQGKFAKLMLYGQSIKLYTHSFLGLGQNEMSHQFLNFPACFEDNYPLPDGGMGKGDAEACAQQVSFLLNNVHEVNQQVQPLLQTNQIDAWYTIGGGINNLITNKPFQFDNDTFTNQSMLEQANKDICQQPWDALNEQYSNNEYLYMYCLLPSYYYSLMVKGYGISPEQTIHLLPGNSGIDWSLGVVLHPNL